MNKQIPNKDLNDLLNVLLNIYCREMGIKKPKLLSPKFFYRMHPCRPKEKKEQGAYCPECNSMYANTEKRCVFHICETVVHELVHLKYPEMQHGKKFDKLVGSIIVCD